MRRVALACVGLIALLPPVAPTPLADAKIVIGGTTQVSRDRICPRNAVLPPPGQRPWVQAAERLAGSDYARAVDDYAIGNTEYDEKALERAYAVFKGGGDGGAKTNASGVLFTLANIRHDVTLIDKAFDLMESEYRQGYTYIVNRLSPWNRGAISARRWSIEYLITKANAADGLKAMDFLKQAEVLAKASDETYRKYFPPPPKPEASPFAVLALRATGAMAARTDDWSKAQVAIAGFRGLMDGLDSDSRIAVASDLVPLLLNSAAYAPDDKRAALISDARLLIREALDDMAKKTAMMQQAENSASGINQTLNRSWSGRDPARDRCLAETGWQGLAAIADLREARIVPAIEAARARLIATDHRLSAMPKFDHAPTYQLAIADSFIRQIAVTPADGQSELREQGRQALDQAVALQTQCFCAFHNAEVARMRAVLTAGDGAV